MGFSRCARPESVRDVSYELLESERSAVPNATKPLNSKVEAANASAVPLKNCGAGTFTARIAIKSATEIRKAGMPNLRIGLSVASVKD